MRYFYLAFAIAVAVGFSSLADVFLKKSHFTLGSAMLLGVLFYALAAPPAAIAFKLVDFSIVFIIWEALAIAMGITLGIVVFHESLSVIKIAAIGASFVTLFLSYLATK